MKSKNVPCDDIHSIASLHQRCLIGRSFKPAKPEGTFG